jgi:serine phosphatase RsbU (regulator of sigma subunit)
VHNVLSEVTGVDEVKQWFILHERIRRNRGSFYWGKHTDPRKLYILHFSMAKRVRVQKQRFQTSEQEEQEDEGDGSVGKREKKGEENRRVKKDAGREKRNDEQGYETMPNSKK